MLIDHMFYITMNMFDIIIYMINNLLYVIIIMLIYRIKMTLKLPIYLESLLFISFLGFIVTFSTSSMVFYNNPTHIYIKY
jgi:hypothetical protein